MVEFEIGKPFTVSDNDELDCEEVIFNLMCIKKTEFTVEFFVLGVGERFRKECAVCLDSYSFKNNNRPQADLPRYCRHPEIGDILIAVREIHSRKDWYKLGDIEYYEACSIPMVDISTNEELEPIEFWAYKNFVSYGGDVYPNPDDLSPTDNNMPFNQQ